MFFADVNLETIVPVGTVTGMLAIIFGWFLRQSARRDQSVENQAARLVAEANQERDYARKERDDARSEAVKLREFYENLLVMQRDELKGEWADTRQFLYDRIAHLEKMVYGEVRTPPQEG